MNDNRFQFVAVNADLSIDELGWRLKSAREFTTYYYWQMRDMSSHVNPCVNLDERDWSWPSRKFTT